MDHELTELRDTLAIEITRELLRVFVVSENSLVDLLKSTYTMADAVLSGRNVGKPVIEKCNPLIDMEGLIVYADDSSIPLGIWRNGKVCRQNVK